MCFCAYLPTASSRSARPPPSPPPPLPRPRRSPIACSVPLDPRQLRDALLRICSASDGDRTSVGEDDPAAGEEGAASEGGYPLGPQAAQIWVDKMSVA